MSNYAALKRFCFIIDFAKIFTRSCHIQLEYKFKMFYDYFACMNAWIFGGHFELTGGVEPTNLWIPFVSLIIWPFHFVNFGKRTDPPRVFRITDPVSKTF